jgi:hypothetical protein
MDQADKPKKKWYRTWWAYSLYAFFAISIVVASVDDKGTAQSVTNNPAPVAVAETKQEVPAAPTVDKKAAQQELTAFMTKAKQATLVTSYEFSDSANVIYVGSVWYSETAVQKKDFLAYVSKLKEAATGYHHFEVHDAYSDEKVAEVTAFSGALKVYK